MKPFVNETKSSSAVNITTENIRATDSSAYFTPAQIAARWGWHVESVRRAIRQRRIESNVIFNRLLVPISEIERIETEGRILRSNEPAVQVKGGV